MGNLLYESEWGFRALSPANLTGENGIHIFPSQPDSDNLRISTGSASLNSDVVAEIWNANQMTILMWVKLNFTPGDGLTHYLLDNRGTDSSTNVIECAIGSTGVLDFTVRDTDSTRHRVSFDMTAWSAGEWHLIVCRIDFKNDEIELYTDGASRDAVPDNALSADSIDAIEVITSIGQRTTQTLHFNGALTYLAESRSWSDAEIAANYDSGAGTPFVVSPDTLALLNTREDATSIAYHPGQIEISSISTVTLTLSAAADAKLAAGDLVVVYDDDDPATAVYTAVVSVSGVTVVVDDSCAAVTGTNKTITRNLWVDGNQESTSTGNVTAGANQTITKDASVVKFDGRSLKDVFAAAANNDESTIAAMTLANGVTIAYSFWLYVDSLVGDLYIDFDGSATPIHTRQLNAGTDDKGAAYAEDTWLFYEGTLQADQADIDLNLRIVGAPQETANAETLNTGTVSSGSLSDTETQNGTDYVLNEVAMTPGYDFEFDFPVSGTGLSFHLFGFYDGNLAHNVDVNAWNGSGWDNIGNLPDAVADTLYNFTLTSAHTNGGVVTIQIDHTSAGNPTHDLNIDHMYVVDSNDAVVYLDQGSVMENMVANPGMEGGADPPASWVQEASATVTSDATPHSGTNALKVVAGAANVGASQAVTLVAGTYYTATIWAQAAAGDTAEMVIDTGDTTEISAGMVTATSMTKIQMTFLATGVSGVVYLRGVANGDIVFFDDADMHREDTAAASAAIKGSGFIPLNNPLYVG